MQIGDDKQLWPVEAGGLWTVFHELAREHQLAAELRTVRRARNPAEAEAWKQLREGRIEQALTWYRDQDRLRLYETRRELQRGLVAEWWERNRDGAMLVDSSNAERDEINRLAQAQRVEAGELGAEVLQLTNGREIRQGDRVLFQEIDYFREDGHTVSPHHVAVSETTSHEQLYTMISRSQEGSRIHALPAEVPERQSPRHRPRPNPLPRKEHQR